MTDAHATTGRRSFAKGLVAVRVSGSLEWSLNGTPAKRE